MGKWLVENPRRPAREVIFHADHTWGVLGYAPDREEVDGRRWSLSGEKLVLTYRGDHERITEGDAIISFSRDRIVTEAFTYTREK